MSAQSNIPPPTTAASDKIIPIKMSMAGINAYYHYCDQYHGRSNYAVCQHTIDAVQERRVQLRSECQGAIESGTCPAIAMRAAEAEAGHALYFIDRSEQLAKIKRDAEALNTTVMYGKRGSVSAGLQTRQASEQSVNEFHERLKAANHIATKPASDDVINLDLAGRNLLGEAVDSLMSEERSE